MGWDGVSWIKFEVCCVYEYEKVNALLNRVSLKYVMEICLVFLVFLLFSHTFSVIRNKWLNKRENTH